MKKIDSINEYKHQYNLAQQDNKNYWDQVAKNLHWFKPYSNVQSGDFNELNVRWFEDGETNLSYNCLDRHLEKSKDKNALIYVKNNPEQDIEFITYEELHTRTCQMANLLKKAGVKKGDRVVFYMGMTPELMTGILPVRE